MFGDVVRAYRRRLGVTQEELAERARLNVRSIGKIESGRTAVPRPRTVRLLADAFGLTGADRDGFCRTAGGEVAPDGSASRPAVSGPGPRPAQLPIAPATFVGRATQLRQLDDLLPRPGQPGPAPVVVAIDGTAGIGKTALAVHWAHRVAGRYADGQLYINLRGFDPGGVPVEPAAVMRRFLHALDVPPQRIPADLDAQAAAYRSELAGRRMLIVLDNARDSAQVRPLLPGAPGSTVVVTSRNQLAGLVAADGAHPITLDLLTVAEAWQLLAHRLGRDRLAAEPDAVEEIITYCAQLPLALAVVAARAAIQPHIHLRTLANRLRDARDRLETLTADDQASDARAAFSWSYDTLTAAAARLFRLLGLHLRPDISTPATASLAGLPLPQARTLLGELVRAHLVIEHKPDRYIVHDLLRAYATEQAHLVDTGDQRHAATRRALDHYLHTADAAARLLHPNRHQVTLTPPAPATTPERPADHEQALDWFTAEHPVLLAAVEHAAATGYDTYTWQLARALSTFLDRRGHWHDRVAVEQAAVAATGRLGDSTGQARAHRNLAGAYTQLGRYDDAYTHLQAALDLASQAGDQLSQAHTHSTLGHLREQQGCHHEALKHARQALVLYQAAGHRVGQARALNQVGWYHARLDDPEQAITHCQRANTLLQELNDREGQAATWDSLGYAYHHLGRDSEAITCYHNAVDLFRHLGDRYYEAGSLTRLGDTHHATGNSDGARTAWQHALSILTDLDHRDARQVRGKLRDLDLAASATPVRRATAAIERASTGSVLRLCPAANTRARQGCSSPVNK